MTKQEIREYIYAGNSTFSLEQYDEQDILYEYTYNVINRSILPTFDVYLVNSKGLKKCIGKLWRDMGWPFDRTCKEYGEPYLRMIDEFTFYLNNNKMETTIKFKQSSICPRCGRPLTDHKSIERGYGLDCWRKMNG